MKVGILGAGQLAKMMALAAHPMNIQTRCLDPKTEVCASAVTPVQQNDYTDQKAIEQFAKSVDYVTFENENIPAETIDWIAAICPTAPAKQSLLCAQDRILEKSLFDTLGIPTPGYRQIDSLDDLEKAAEQLGLPALLKTRRFGYDGKGQFLIRERAQITTAWETLGKENLILEQFIPFDFEVSQIMVRNRTGEINYYPLVRNEHTNGILRQSHAPYINSALEETAQQYCKKIATHFDYVGILTVEFFVKENQLTANEMAPRVHNSGHWTIEGSETSQFENHIRAICDLPLGSCQSRGQATMFNIIGKEPLASEMLAIEHSHFHSYGKSPEPNRKVGHVTVQTNDTITFSQSVEKMTLYLKD